MGRQAAHRRRRHAGSHRTDGGLHAVQSREILDLPRGGSGGGEEWENECDGVRIEKIVAGCKLQKHTSATYNMQHVVERLHLSTFLDSTSNFPDAAPIPQIINSSCGISLLQGLFLVHNPDSGLPCCPSWRHVWAARFFSISLYTGGQIVPGLWTWDCGHPPNIQGTSVTARQIGR